MAAWCVVRGIDYLVEECPMAKGNRHLGLQRDLELDRGGARPGRRPPSTWDSSIAWLRCSSAIRAAAVDGLNECALCGSPTTGDVCAFCRLLEKSRAIEPVPVEFVLSTRGGKGRR